MPSKTFKYSIFVTSGTLDVKAQRNTIVDCMEFIRQVKKVGYYEGFALIKSNDTNLVLTQIDLNYDQR